MYYIVKKNDRKIIGYYENIETLINSKYFNDNNYMFLEDISMNTILRIVEVDGKCVYNSKDFWLNEASYILNDYENHSIKDILGSDIDKSRFILEYNTICPRIISIDGRPGQISYNMEVGKEFVSLFREECILTKFTKESDTSPMIIFEKLTPVIAMLDAGAFREAKQYLQGYRAKIKDDFLTDERIDKYIAMLDAADAIEYATEEDYFYKAPEDV